MRRVRAGVGRCLGFGRALGAAPVALGLMAGLVLNTPAQADLPSIPPQIRIITEGSGTQERVVRFERIPNAAFLSDQPLLQLAADMAGADSAKRDAAMFNTGMILFGDGFGLSATLGTLAEHAAMLNGFSAINSAFTWGGLIFTVASASKDFAEGNPESGLATSLKGLMSFAISKWGWGALQVGGASMFFIDLTLREWADATFDAGLDNFREVYRASYADNPRGVNEWKRRAWEIYLVAEQRSAGSKDATAALYRDMMNAEVTRYVSREFTAEMLLYWEKNRTGLGMFGDQEDVEDMLAAEHRTEIEAMLVKKVFPDIARRAASRAMDQLVATYNGGLRRDLNGMITLELTAWGVQGPAAVTMPFADGGGWNWQTGADGTLIQPITRLAFLKAGMPQQVVLEAGGAVQERAVRVIDNRIIAIFGEPKAATVTRMRLTEGPRWCRLIRRDAATGAVIDSTAAEFPALPETVMDMAVLPSGVVVAGVYDAATGRWRDASPGVWRFGNELHFGPPKLNGIETMTDCNVDLLTSEGKTATARCNLYRRDEAVNARGERVERRCDSTASTDMVGVFADTGQGLTYFDMSGAEGKALVDVLRRSMREGIKGFDPAMLQGMTPGQMRDLGQMPKGMLP